MSLLSTVTTGMKVAIAAQKASVVFLKYKVLGYRKYLKPDMEAYVAANTEEITDENFSVELLRWHIVNQVPLTMILKNPSKIEDVIRTSVSKTVLMKHLHEHLTELAAQQSGGNEPPQEEQLPC